MRVKKEETTEEQVNQNRAPTLAQSLDPPLELMLEEVVDEVTLN